MVYGTCNELVTVAFVNQFITGGHHFVLTYILDNPRYMLCFLLYRLHIHQNVKLTYQTGHVK